MSNNNITSLDNRRYVLGGVACLIIFVFITRLFYLQIINNEYKDSAKSNAFFHKTSYPSRGTMSDREGRLLVYNQPTYDVLYIPLEAQGLDTLEFCKTLGITIEQYEKRIEYVKNKKRNPGYSSYTMQTFMTQLTTEESSLFQEKLYKFPGFFIQNRTLRQYSYPNAGLLLGYVAEVSREQMNRDDYYVRGDYGGKSGLEAQYEKILRGEKGYEVFLRDARGRVQGNYEEGIHDKPAISGKNLKLSIDIELQAYGEYLLQNKVGSIVMIEPETGEVLCMITSPSYDPSVLQGRNFGKNFTELNENPLKPLYNRAAQGIYPPGSVFKPSQGLTYLQEGIVNNYSAFPCSMGYAPLGGKPACHGHASPTNLEGAIATSCNSYFCYGLTAMLHNNKYNSVEEAFDIWKDHMVDLGFGYKLGIDLPSESQGFIPNSSYYTKHYGKNGWKASTVISISIGQGEILTTPLQIANFAAIMANRGHYYTPHLVKEIEDTPLDTLYTNKHSSGIETKHFHSVVEGMYKAVTSGTCRKANLLPEIAVCGKTGTAQNPHGDDHSIFMGFAPKDKPKVAISVVIENGGFGATYAVPIGRLMMSKYLNENMSETDKYYEEIMAKSVILPDEFVKWKRNKTRNNR